MNQLVAPFKDILVATIGDKCYISLFEKLNYKDSNCVKLLLSKAIGYGIVVSSAIVKVLFRIVWARHNSS
jgi:mannose-P-dolichol utilization defect protein 1